MDPKKKEWYKKKKHGDEKKKDWEEKENLQKILQEAEKMVTKLKLETSTRLWKEEQDEFKMFGTKNGSNGRRTRRSSSSTTSSSSNTAQKDPRRSVEQWHGESCDSNTECTSCYESCKEEEHVSWNKDDSEDEPCLMYERFVRLGVDWPSNSKERKGPRK